VPRPSSTPGAERRLAALRLAGLVLFVGALFAVVALSGSLSAGRVRDWVDGAGVAAPLVFIALSAAMSVCLFPGPLLAGASGLLFGTWLGFPVTLCSTVLGACSAFCLSRFAAGDAVEQLGGPRLLRLRDAVGRRGFLSVLYARIAPGIPYNLVNYAAGLTPVRLGAFAAATALGTAPRAFAYTALGGSIGEWSSPEAIAAAAVLAAMAIAGAWLWWRGYRAGVQVQ
jgi:uncharacterized membrane protein YdjX (TVP38/TMEM64 family)